MATMPGADECLSNPTPGDDTDEDVGVNLNADEETDEGFLVIQDISPRSMGYFENKEKTGFINVLKDRIIYNQYESLKDRKLYNKGHRSWIQPKEYFINILPQTINTMPITLGHDCGFEYNSKWDVWISKNAENDIPDTSWQRASLAMIFNLSQH